MVRVQIPEMYLCARRVPRWTPAGAGESAMCGSAVRRRTAAGRGRWRRGGLWVPEICPACELQRCATRQRQAMMIARVPPSALSDLHPGLRLAGSARPLTGAGITPNCWYSGTRSPCHAAPFRGPGWTGPTARSSPAACPRPSTVRFRPVIQIPDKAGQLWNTPEPCTLVPEPTVARS